uniref:Uncharacterized protein n=1 Tax=Picea sitchensis TaxID=3332 RepID=A0A6B9XRR9_PICSI|nr:hypothetical protein Q903MT_gene6679 [Picea sitchensis]
MMELRMDDGIVIRSYPEIGVDLGSCSRSSLMIDFTGELVARLTESITGS